MTVRVGNAGVDLYTHITDNTVWKQNTILFTGDTVLIAENEKDLQELAKELDTVCQKINVQKTKTGF